MLYGINESHAGKQKKRARLFELTRQAWTPHHRLHLSAKQKQDSGGFKPPQNASVQNSD